MQQRVLPWGQIHVGVVDLGVWRPPAYEMRVSFADVFVFVTECNIE